MRIFHAPGRTVTQDGDAYVIAEVGHNHQGNMETAKRLIKAAKDAGADAVKLQKRDNQSLFTADYYNKPYEHENSFGSTYGKHREALELGRDQYVELIAYAKQVGITLFATAFDFPSVDFLADLQMPMFKLASADLSNTPLIRHVARLKVPLIISTGGATFEDVRRAVDTVLEHHANLAILQCTAAYPCAYEDLNLRVISRYLDMYPKHIVGLSAHDDGISVPVAAYTLGARIIEKHFTLARSMKGTDHAFSLDPTAFETMVRDLHNTRLALGDGEKRLLKSEQAPLQKMSKKLVASRDLPAGHVLSREDIAIKSPGGGLAPFHLDSLIGRALKQAVHRDEALSLDKLSEAQRGAKSERRQVA